MLRRGDKGWKVEALQESLRRVGMGITADGDYGPATEQAVRAFQRQNDLVVDGIAGPKTRAALHRGNVPEAKGAKTLGQSDLIAAAEQLGVELAAVMAVNEVESRGKGLHIGGPRTGEPIILFERHIMRRRLIEHSIDPATYQRTHPQIVNASPGGYQGGSREHDRLDRARLIHIESAIESASWGLFQIMGYHWQSLGYASSAAWLEAMKASEGHQLEAFVRFIEIDPRLHRALRDRDWSTFAKIYNGPAHRDYDLKMAAAYRTHTLSLVAA